MDMTNLAEAGAAFAERKAAIDGLSRRRAYGRRVRSRRSRGAGLGTRRADFVNRDKAARSLQRNLGDVGGRTPMNLIRIDAGARVLEGLVARIRR